MQKAEQTKVEDGDLNIHATTAYGDIVARSL
jgi:hypothetical protein